MRADIRRHLVAYDSSDDHRRLRIANALSAYGDRVQYSVFIVDASPVRLARMRRRVMELMDPTEDSVLICDLGLREGVGANRYICLGRQRQITTGDSFIVWRSAARGSPTRFCSRTARAALGLVSRALPILAAKATSGTIPQTGKPSRLAATTQVRW
jgi:CRISPR-associated protein Cas2